MLILARSDISHLLAIDDVIAAVEAAAGAVATGQAVEGTRNPLALPDSSAIMIPMVAAVGPARVAGLKVLTDSPDNPSRGLPRQQSVVVLLDPKTNAVEAVLDGAELTRMRTAAASAVATKYLAREGVTTLGLIGAGGLAAAHLEAIRAVRPIARVEVWSRTFGTACDFADRAGTAAVDVVPLRSITEVVARCDIICTLTPAAEPLLRGSWLRPGMHVNAVGAPPRPNYREIDTETLRRSRIIVDSVEAALHESGAVRLALAERAITEDDVADDLGSVISGIAPGRTNDSQITLYNSVGLGIQDVATARLLVDLSRRKGVGTEIALTGGVPTSAG